MSYKTILVHLADIRRAKRLLDVAVPLAAKMKSHLIGLSILPPYVVVPAMDMGGAAITVDDHRKAYRAEMTTTVDNYADFQHVLDSKGGFIWAHWDGTTETADQIKEETKATIRCLPLDNSADEAGVCIKSGKPSERRVLFARAY